MFNYFYHEKTRKAKMIFQALFSNINVVRTKKDGTVINQQKVPVSYASRKHFIERIANDDDTVAMKLPRISIEMTDMVRRSMHQLPKTNTFVTNATNGQVKKFYTATPYQLNFQVIVATKSEDDMHQIVEQILPYFAPSYTITIKPFNDYPDIKEDIPVSLVSVSQEDNYEGMIEDRSSYFYYLDFEMHTDYYGPISDTNIIKKAIVDFHDMDSDETKMTRITVTPDPASADADTGSYITTYVHPGLGDSA